MKKLVNIVISLMLLQSITLPVFADTQTIEYDSSVNDTSSTTSNVGVEVERAEIYSVTLPKSVVLQVNTEDGTAEHSFDIDVSGEVSSNHYVRVIPYDTASIIDEGEVLNYKLKVEGLFIEKIKKKGKI